MAPQYKYNNFYEELRSPFSIIGLDSETPIMKQRSLSNLHARWHHHLEPLKKKGLFWQEVVHSHHHYRIRITYRENVKANLRMNGLTSLEKKTSFWHWRLSRLLSSFNAQKLATRGVLILQESFFAVIIRKIKGVRQLIKIKIFKSRSYCSLSMR